MPNSDLRPRLRACATGDPALKFSAAHKQKTAPRFLASPVRRKAARHAPNSSRRIFLVVRFFLSCFEREIPGRGHPGLQARLRQKQRANASPTFSPPSLQRRRGWDPLPDHSLSRDPRGRARSSGTCVASCRRNTQRGHWRAEAGRWRGWHWPSPVAEVQAHRALCPWTSGKALFPRRSPCTLPPKERAGVRGPRGQSTLTAPVRPCLMLASPSSRP